MAYYINLFLTKGILPTGQMHSITEEESKNISVSETVKKQSMFTPTNSITGETTSRLDEVRTYNKTTPFIAGVQGVKEVHPDRIKYTIDGIEFITFLEDERTIYSFGVGGINESNSDNTYITKREKDSFIEKVPTENDIMIDRGEVSVFESMYKMNDINSLDDFINYF